MIRRTVLQGAASALIRPVNAPRAVQPAPGVQPGSQQNIRARVVIVSGSNDGVFVYSGRPAPGNLIASIVSSSVPTTDPFGNPVEPGIVSYSGAGFAALAGAGLTLQNGSFPWQVQVDPTSGLLVFQFPHTSAQIFMSDNATGYFVAAQPGTLAPEEWHDVVPPAGFTGTLRYMLGIENNVKVMAQMAVAAGAPTGTVTLINLPANGAYTPVKTQHDACGIFLNGAPSSLAAVQGIMNLRWSADPAGTFTLRGFPGGAAGTGVTECSFNADYSLG